MNFIVILLNGGMPVDIRHMPENAVNKLLSSGTHVIMNESTWMPWLGDIIHLNFLPGMISIGDILLLAGVILFLYTFAISEISKTKFSVKI